MGALDLLKRYAEPALTLGSGALAEPIAGWAGILSGGDPDAIAKARAALTYQPRSQEGQAGLAALANALRAAKTNVVDNTPIGSAVNAFGNAADYVGDRNALAGALMRTAPAAALTFLGPGGALSRNAVASAVRGGESAGRGIIANASAVPSMRGPMAMQRGSLGSNVDAMINQSIPSETIMPKINSFDLYHGSHGVVDQIKDTGTFRGVFASPSKDSALSHGDNLHKISMNEDDVLTQNHLDYHADNGEVVSALKRVAGDAFDEYPDDIYDIVVGNKSLWNADLPDDVMKKVFGSSDIGEADWEAQAMRGQLAKKLGFKAVEMPDEHGTSYLVLPGVPINKK